MRVIKILKASSYYNSYLKKFYFSRPNLKNESYEKHYAEIMKDCSAWSDFWKKNLEKLGNYEVMEVVMNAELMQKQWAKEQNIAFSKNNWGLEILEAQINNFKPDVFFAHDFLSITPTFRVKMKNIYPSLKIISWDGVAKKDENLFAQCDLVMSPLKEVAEYYNSRGLKGFYILSGFEKSILEKVSENSQKINCSFIGSIFGGEDRHNERLRLVSYLSKKTNLGIWIPNLPSYKQLSKELVKNVLKMSSVVFQISDIFNLLRLKKLNRGAAFGLQMYQVLNESKITINSHIGTAGNASANMRMFEATGVGTCLITDWKDNLSELFEIDKEVVAYKSPEECFEKIEYLLKHEDIRENIAKAGQKRTLENYSMEKRMIEFSEFLTNHIL